MNAEDANGAQEARPTNGQAVVYNNNSNTEAQPPVANTGKRVTLRRTLKKAPNKAVTNTPAVQSAQVAIDPYANLPPLEKVYENQFVPALNMLENVNNITPTPPYKLSPKLTELAETADRQFNAEGQPVFTPEELEETLKKEGKLPQYYLWLLPSEILSKLNTESLAFLETKRETDESVINPQLLGGPPGSIFDYVKRSYPSENIQIVRKLFPKTLKKLKSAVIIPPVTVQETNAPVDTNTNVQQAQSPATGCEQMYDPCTGQIIQDENPISVIQKRITKLQREQKLSTYQELPIELQGTKTRLDLLLWLCNLDVSLEEINENLLLNYKKGTNQFNTSLFESYWDIVIALGEIDIFERTNKRYLVNDKAENLTNTDPESSSSMIQDPFNYLSKREIQTSSSGGASDITVLFTEKKMVSPTFDSCLTSITSETDELKPLFYFASVKYYNKDNQKSVDKYDVQNIYTAAKRLNQDKINKKIVLLVKDADAVTRNFRNAFREYIAEEARFIYGLPHLLSALRKIYTFVKSNKTEIPVSIDTLRHLYHIDKQPKPNLQLRLHQYLAVRVIEDGIKRFKQNTAKTKNNKFLIGILPRGGKTFVAGGLINTIKPKRCVVILGAKSETQSQFIDELFNYYNDFNDYSIIDVKDVTSPELSAGQLDSDKKYIFVMSIELFKNQEITSRPLLQLLRGKSNLENRADLFICDEGHLKQVTHQAQIAIKGAAIKNEDDIEDSSGTLEAITKQFSSTPIVYMTGTYRKVKLGFEIPDTQCVVWDYEDLQRAKNMIDEFPYFQNAFGSYFDEALEFCKLMGQSEDDIMNVYKKFPEIHLMTTHFIPEVRNGFLEQASKNKTAGISSLSSLFTLNKGYNFSDPSTWYLGFRMSKQLTRLINFLGPSRFATTTIQINNTNQDITAVPSILDAIDDVAQRVGDRLQFVTRDFIPHSQLWFLPKVSGSPLPLRMMALAGLVFQHPWFCDNFHILAVTTTADWTTLLSGLEKENNTYIIPSTTGKKGHFSVTCPSRNFNSLKQCILVEEENARKHGKGLIILAQNMLQLGISLKCVDVVVLLDDTENVDERIQKMYRALTESINKKAGFVVDLNYRRTVKAILEYQIQALTIRKRRAPTKEELDSILNTIFNIYSFNDNQPLFSIKEERNREIAELQKELTGLRTIKLPTDLVNAGRAINNNIEESINFDPVTMNLLLEYKVGTKKANKKDFFRRQETALKRATARKLENLSSNNENENHEEENKFEYPISKTEEERLLKLQASFQDIFKTLLRVGIFTTDNKSIEEFIEKLKTDSEQQEFIRDLLIKRSIIKDTVTTEDLFSKIIFPNIEKYIAQGRGQHYTVMKEHVNDPKKYPEKADEVLKYINEHLAPKDIERHKFGEVFTPLSLVDEMLSKLPEDVWTNPDLKWLDPANGMGNFPIKAYLGQSDGEYTYPGLFKGLSKKIPDDKKRAKHIVENMLFMIDINPKNNAIAKKLFEKIAPGTKPNVEQIDRKNGFLSDKPLVFNGKTIDSFDIIMGNPPFNPPKTESGSSGNVIWPNFVMKSYSLLKNDGYLLFVHPPGWKKPTDEIFKSEKFADGDYTPQIRQGQVWKILKETGVFKFIYTNDQKSKLIGEDYLPHFPAVDYYVYQKGGDNSICDTKNIFLGTLDRSKGVRLNYNLKYLPNLITKQTQDILHKVTSKAGDKPSFKAGFDPRGFKSKDTGSIKYIYDASAKGPNYTFYKERVDNVDISKVVLNENGGINGFYCKFIDKSEHIGVLHHTLLYPVEKTAGKNIEKFFNSDLVKFVFLITQYSSGKMTINEKLVANSITIPSEGIVDYYKFFGIEEHKKYIEDILEHYELFKAPKRLAKTEKVKRGGYILHNKTRKNRKNRKD